MSITWLFVFIPIHDTIHLWVGIIIKCPIFIIINVNQIWSMFNSVIFVFFVRTNSKMNFNSSISFIDLFNDLFSRVTELSQISHFIRPWFSYIGPFGTSFSFIWKPFFFWKTNSISILESQTTDQSSISNISEWNWTWFIGVVNNNGWVSVDTHIIFPI